MRVKIKKLDDKAIIPSYARSGDAGMDLTATSIKNTNSDGYNYIEYGTSLLMEIPDGYVGLIYPRSSLSKTGLIMANSVAVIDSSYRGEILLRFKYVDGGVKYKIGERIAQIMIVPYPTIEFVEQDILSETERGSGGFGSTN